MTGCGSKENKNDTNLEKETKTQKNETKKGNSKYFKNFDRKYKLSNSMYSISIQKDASMKHIFSVNQFLLTNKNNKE